MNPSIVKTRLRDSSSDDAILSAMRMSGWAIPPRLEWELAVCTYVVSPYKFRDMFLY